MTNQAEQAPNIEVVDLLTWRLQRLSAEKHVAEVNRALLRRPH